MKTNEELFEEWWASVIFDLEPTEFKVKKAFLAACEIKDKEIERLNKKYQEDTYEMATLFSEKNKKLKEQLGKAVEALELIALDNIFVAENGWRDEHFLDVKQAKEALRIIKQLEQG